MPFDRTLLPIDYFKGQGVPLKGLGKWKTGKCDFHLGGDSLRVNADSGAWMCMACGVKGGDVLSYEMLRHGTYFVEASMALGAWTNTGRDSSHKMPLPFSPRAALEVISFQCLVVAMAACSLAKGSDLSASDRYRPVEAASRIRFIAKEAVR